MNHFELLPESHSFLAVMHKHALHIHPVNSLVWALLVYAMGDGRMIYLSAQSAKLHWRTNHPLRIPNADWCWLLAAGCHALFTFVRAVERVRVFVLACACALVSWCVRALLCVSRGTRVSTSTLLVVGEVVQ